MTVLEQLLSTEVVIRAGLVVVALAVAWVISWLYRCSDRVLGEPSGDGGEYGDDDPFRSDRSPDRELSAYHAGFLRYPDLLPGYVALVTLLAMQRVRIEGGRWFADGDPNGLDEYQRKALDQSQGFQTLVLMQSLSLQFREALKLELAGTTLVTPPATLNVTTAALVGLGSGIVGVCALIVGVGQWLGGLAIVAVLFAYRAARARDLFAGTHLSRAGWAALRQLEVNLDASVRGRDGSDYSFEQIGLYVGLKPLYYERVPGIDDRFQPLLDRVPAAEVGTNPRLGPRLSAERLQAARIVNTRRAVVFIVGGASLLIVGTTTGLSFAAESSGAAMGASAVVTVVAAVVALILRRVRRNCQ